MLSTTKIPTLCACGCNRPLPEERGKTAKYLPECRKHHARDSRRRAAQNGKCVQCLRKKATVGRHCKSCHVKAKKYYKKRQQKLKDARPIKLCICGCRNFAQSSYHKYAKGCFAKLDKEKSKEVRRKRREQGLCVRCGEKSERYLCNPCWEKYKVINCRDTKTNKRRICPACKEIGHTRLRCPMLAKAA